MQILEWSLESSWIQPTVARECEKQVALANLLVEWQLGVSDYEQEAATELVKSRFVNNHQ